MADVCGDNRFEIIARAKQAILDGTNIDTSPDEMKVLNNFLFRCWQMGWLDKYDVPDTNVGEWIPCSEGLPEELTPVNVTWVNRKPTIYYENIKDIPFTATAVYCNKKWFWWSVICEDILAEYGRNDAEMVDEGVEILAWMPLPPSYKESED